MFLPRKFPATGLISDKTCPLIRHKNKLTYFQNNKQIDLIENRF